MTWDHLDEFYADISYWADLEIALREAGYLSAAPSYLPPRLEGEKMIIPNGPSNEPNYDYSKIYEIRFGGGVFTRYSSGHSDERGYREWKDSPLESFSTFELAGKYFIYKEIASTVRFKLRVDRQIPLPIIGHRWIQLAATEGLPPGWTSEVVPPSGGNRGDVVYRELATGRSFTGFGDEPSVTWLLRHSYEELRSIYSDGLLGLAS